MDNGSKIGERIRDDRGAKGLNVYQLHQKVEKLTLERGTSYGTIRAYDRGEVAHPRKEIIIAIAQALGVSKTWLLTGDGHRDDAEASLPRDPMAEPQGFGAEVFDRLYEMTQEVLNEYGPHSVPLEAGQVLLCLVARIYGERGPEAFWREVGFPAEWKGWETQREHFGSKPGVTKPDIKDLLEWHLGLGPVLDVNPRQSYGERVSGWLSALARVYIQEFGSGRNPDTASRRESKQDSTEPKEHAVEKVVPDDDVLDQAYRRAVGRARAQEAIEKVTHDLDAVKVPDGLGDLVRKHLEEDRSETWEEAVAAVMIHTGTEES